MYIYGVSQNQITAMVGLIVVIGPIVLIGYNSRIKTLKNVQPSPESDPLKEISLRQLFLTMAFSVQAAGKRIWSNRDNKNFTFIERNSYMTMKTIIGKHFPNINIRSEYENESMDNFQEIGMPENWGKIPDEMARSLLSQLDDSSDTLIPIDSNITIWIDPLDGSKDFIEQLIHFVSTQACVAINGKPIMGFIYFPFHYTNHTDPSHEINYSSDNLRFTAPAIMTSNSLQFSWLDRGKSKHGDMDDMFTHDDFHYLKASKYNRLIAVSRSSPPDLTNLIATSVKAVNPDLNVTFAAYGCVGYKLTSVFSQKSYAYVHTGPINRWDICAGDAIIKAHMPNHAGIKSFQGRSITYGKDVSAIFDGGIMASLDDTFSLALTTEPFADDVDHDDYI